MRRKSDHRPAGGINIAGMSVAPPHCRQPFPKAVGLLELRRYNEGSAAVDVTPLFRLSRLGCRQSFRRHIYRLQDRGCDHSPGGVDQAVLAVDADRIQAGLLIVSRGNSAGNWHNSQQNHTQCCQDPAFHAHHPPVRHVERYPVAARTAGCQCSGNAPSGRSGAAGHRGHTESLCREFHYS